MSTKTINQAELTEALELVIKNTRNIGRQIRVPLFDALGLVLAEDIICQKALPAFDNSAMDGYGVKASDSGRSVKIISTIMAGDNPSSAELCGGETIKIMTGALVPSSIEAVVPFENATINADGTVTLPEFKAGANIRQMGEEANIGDLLIKKGTKLTPSHIGQIASQGKFVTQVSDRVKVAVLSTGDELIEPWQSASEHQIYNSNATTLIALCKEQNCEVNYIKAISDSYEGTRDTIRSLRGYDLILTSGGISMGEADFVGKAFLECGLEPIFKKVNIKPGKPTMMGYMGDTAVLALPGNPLSAIVNFYLFGVPLISRIQGRLDCYPTFATAKNVGEFKIKNARANVVLGTLANGEFRAYNGYKYGSGMISPIANSNAFIVCGEGVSGIGDNQEVKVVMLDGVLSHAESEFIL